MTWEPFLLAPRGERGDPPRSIQTQEGIGDRLRSAAFAEIQAKVAFIWAAETFTDAPSDLRRAWQALALAEERHLNWLLERMKELQIDVQARRVSDHLFVSLTSCKTAQEFAIYMANSEEWGRKAGLQFYEHLKTKDPKTAEIFGKIAEEEIAHIALAKKYFPAHDLHISQPWNRVPHRGSKV
ncbi:MAG: DUF455 family protein [Bdellovibrionia bacterium]